MLSLVLPESILRITIIPLLLAICTGVGWYGLWPLVKRVGEDWFERWALCLLGGIVFISWIGVILATLGLFKIWLFAFLLVICGWLARRTLLKQEQAAPSASGSEPESVCAKSPWHVRLINALMVLLLLGAGWLYARPAESFLLTDDSAVYTIAGIVLARDGTLYYEPEMIYDFEALWNQDALDHISSMDPYIAFSQQFSFMQTSGPVLTRHVGPFYGWPLRNPRIEIGFLAFPKVWAALCVWLFSAAYATWAVPFMGVTGLTLFYLLSRRIAGSASGLAAALLLAVSFTQVWFARFPLSEMHTQVLIVGVIYLVARARSHPDERIAHALAVFAGLALGLLPALRFESPVLLALLCGLIIVAWIAGRSNRPALSTFLRVVLGTSALAMLMSLLTAPFYFLTRTLTVLPSAVVKLATVGTIAAIAGAAWILTHKLQARAWLGSKTCSRLAGFAPTVIGCALGLWLIFSALLTFAGDPQTGLTTWLWGYWGNITLLLAIVGSGLILWPRQSFRQPALDAVPLVGTATAFLLLYAINPMITAVHPWAIRRTVPFIGPMLAMGAGILPGTVQRFLDAHSSPAPRAMRVLLKAVPWALVAACLFATGSVSFPFLQHTERQGMWTGLNQLDAALPDNAILLTGDGEVGRRLPQAMEMVFGHPAYSLRNTQALDPDSDVVNHLISSAYAQGRPIYFVAADGDRGWRPKNWRLEPTTSFSINTRTLTSTFVGPPTADRLSTQTFFLDIYQVLPRELSATRAIPSTVEVPLAAGSYPYLYDGFYSVERTTEDVTFRWTEKDATLTLPWPAAGGSADFCLTLDFSSWRPAGIDAPVVTILAEDRVIYAGQVNAQGRDQLTIGALDIVNTDLPELEIDISCTSWTPAEHSGSADNRELGLMLYGATVSTAGECP